MRILALETSTEHGFAALWHDGQIVERRCPAGQSHSSTLLPLVRGLLDEAGWGFADLDGIAFGAGPGAFTGLRVACAVAQGLAVAADLPLLPVVTLQAMALAAAKEAAEATGAAGGGEILALLDARMGEVYWAAYRAGENGPAPTGDIRLSAPQEIVLPQSAGWLAAGNALAAYPPLAEQVAAAGGRGLPHILPRAACVAHLAAPRLAAGEGVDAALAAPLYVRDKVAQTIAERLQQGGRA